MICRTKYIHFVYIGRMHMERSFFRASPTKIVISMILSRFVIIQVVVLIPRENGKRLRII